MYKNVGKKIKALASITAVLGIIAGIVLGIILLVDGSTLEGVLMLILLPILSWISCLTLYAFGDIVIKINHIAKTVCGDIENEEEEEEYEEEEEEYEEEDENDKGQMSKEKITQLKRLKEQVSISEERYKKFLEECTAQIIEE